MISPLVRGEKDFGFLNLFLGDESYPQEPESIYMLYNPVFTKKYMDYEKELTSYKLYRGYYNVASGFVMHIVSVPPIFIDDYHKFLLGDYSQFSDYYKSKFRQGSKAYDVVNGLCNFPMWNPELEIFKKQTLIKSIQKWKVEKLELN